MRVHRCGIVHEMSQPVELFRGRGRRVLSLLATDLTVSHGSSESAEIQRTGGGKEAALFSFLGRVDAGREESGMDEITGQKLAAVLLRRFDLCITQKIGKGWAHIRSGDSYAFLVAEIRFRFVGVVWSKQRADGE